MRLRRFLTLCAALLTLAGAVASAAHADLSGPGNPPPPPPVKNG